MIKRKRMIEIDRYTLEEHICQNKIVITLPQDREKRMLSQIELSIILQAVKSFYG